MRNYVYISRDNWVELRVIFEGDFNLLNFEIIEIGIGGARLDSDNHAHAVSYNEDIITLRIGEELAGVPRGQYPVHLVGYSSLYPNGFVLTCAGAEKVAPLKVLDC